MSRFIIYAGQENVNDFIVVSDDGATPLVLDPSDTATISIYTSGLSPSCILGNVPLALIDADNGLFELTLTAEQTSLLKQDIGFKEDKYSALSNYRGQLRFVLVSGNKQAKIDIYVEESLECLV